MIDPKNVALFIPGGLREFKLGLFNRIGKYIEDHGGQIVRTSESKLKFLPNHIIPIVGASPALRPIVQDWRRKGRAWIGWDRGYLRRVFATWLPRADSLATSFYRWHLNGYQMQVIRDVPDDRWKQLKIDVAPWNKNGRHIVLAPPTKTYMASHGCEGWIENTLLALAKVTTRQIVIRDKETKRPLQDDLKDAHALVAHGSIAAVESVVLGCPVFVDKCSAAALVGQTDLTNIEKPIYPDRQPWLNSLSYSNFSESEMTSGEIWKMIS